MYVIAKQQKNLTLKTEDSAKIKNKIFQLLMNATNFQIS